MDSSLTRLSNLEAQIQQGPGARQQGRRRGAPPMTPPPATPVPSPSTAPVGPTDPTVANIPDKWTVTHHTMVVDGKPLNYTATCGFLPVRNAQGAIQANMFFVSYTKDGEDHHKRPVVFAFNGGPGSSSVWLHLGTLGPRRAAMTYDGFMPKPPFKLEDNQETWLTDSDVVMLDAIGTGYSQTVTPGDRQFYGVNGDLQAFTSGIVSYVSYENRWLSPIFVAGESYGGFRVAGLSKTLLDAGIACNGIISISGVLNLPTIDGSKGNDLPFISFLPSETGVAWYHKRLSPERQQSLTDTVNASEKFAEGPYAHALMMGSSLGAKEKESIAKELSSFIGLPVQYIMNSNLRVPEFQFMAELLRDKGESTGRYDGRLVGMMSDGNRQYPEYDASDSATSPVFTSTFNDYIKTELNFNMSTPYNIMGRTYGWDYSGQTDTSDDLRQAMTQNPAMQVMFCFSRFDLACPYFGTMYVVRHMDEPAAVAKNIHFDFYQSGHMLYIDTPSRIKLHQDFHNFVLNATK